MLPETEVASYAKELLQFKRSFIYVIAYFRAIRAILLAAVAAGFISVMGT
jgi:hypothetical protein